MKMGALEIPENLRERVVRMERRLPAHSEDNEQVKIWFTNGWAVSLIFGPYSYGGPQGFFEMAAIGPEDGFLQDNPATGDEVMGWLTASDVVSKIDQISRL